MNDDMCVCVCWRWGADIEGLESSCRAPHAKHTVDWTKGYLTCLWVIVCSPGISLADSWTAHYHSACDLRGIWSRPVPDPGLSVVTKHPSGSTNSALRVWMTAQQQMALLSVETYFMPQGVVRRIAVGIEERMTRGEKEWEGCRLRWIYQVHT